MQLGRLGVWASMDGMSATAAARLRPAGRGLGLRCALVAGIARQERAGRSPAGSCAARKTLTVATGIANIYARDAQATASGQLALAEQSGGRFLLGLGVSHVPLVEGLRGHGYGKPVETMRGYVEAMRRASYTSPRPAEAPKTVIAALGPNMLALAAVGCRRRASVPGLAGAHARGAGHHGRRQAAVSGADRARRERSRSGTAHRTRMAGPLPRDAELPQQPAPSRLRRGGLRQWRLRSPGRRDDRLGRHGRDPPAHRRSTRRPGRITSASRRSIPTRPHPASPTSGCSPRSRQSSGHYGEENAP